MIRRKRIDELLKHGHEADQPSKVVNQLVRLFELTCFSPALGAWLS